MANVYVYSGAAGGGTGADWTNAYTTLVAAFTAKAAGDDFWVAHDHAETAAAAKIIAAKGTAAAPNRIICVNRAGSVPPVSADLRTTATITTTGAFAITLGAGVGYFYGITFSSGSGVVSAGITASNTAGAWVLDQCKLSSPGTTLSATKIAIGTTSSGVRQRFTLIGTTLQFGNVNDSISIQEVGFVWRNTLNAIAGAIFPTTLFGGAYPAAVLLEGVDLSALGSGKTLVGAASSAKQFVFKDCKLGASVTISAAPTDQGGHEAILIRCDSGDTNYRTEKYRHEGTLTTKTTIVRTGGASDGTTPIAWEIVTSANSKRYMPFEALPISIWNETVGSAITLTVQGIWGGGAVPTNADIWMDVEFLGTSGFPIGSFTTSGPADQLAAGTNLPAGSGTWGGSTTKFALTVSITPQEKGPITVYVKAAAASQTFYIDPLITVT